MTDAPIACSLPGPERQERREQLLEKVFSRVEETRPLDDGYAFRFAAHEDLLAELMQLIQIEHQCCAFLRLRLTVDPAGGPVWLELTGPPGTKTFLESAFGSGQRAAGRSA